ncbi:MAG: RNA methyltransferase [Henriciella sp.]|nr:RNA methyltransferase [Henriciella sp.]
MSKTVSITNSKDPRIAPYTAIRERDLTGGTDGRFIVEGKVTLGILLQRSRFEVHSLFLCETRLEPLADLLKSVPNHVPIYTAPQGLMDEIAGFPIHRGVLACAKKGDSLNLSSLIGPKRLLILNQISNHDNVGAAFRNAAAFGAGGVILDAGSCDPLYRKAIRVSSGSSLWLPYHHGGTGSEHIKALKDAGYAVWAMTPRDSAIPLHDMPIPEKVAILLGAEGTGLPDRLIEQADAVRIPMSTGFDSVNVATAGAIALSAVFNAD